MSSKPTVAPLIRLYINMSLSVIFIIKISLLHDHLYNCIQNITVNKSSQLQKAIQIPLHGRPAPPSR
jgi:hypothetical protein